MSDEHLHRTVWERGARTWGTIALTLAVLGEEREGEHKRRKG